MKPFPDLQPTKRTLGCTLMILMCAFTLSACGGGGGHRAVTGSDGGSETTSADLYYSYPAEGQRDVATRAPLVLGFLGKLNLQAGDFALSGPQGPVAFDLKSVNGGSGVVLTPRQPLAPNSEYQLTAQGLTGADGGALLPGGKLTFTTRAALEGPATQQETDAAFQVSAISPDGVQLPMLDFSTINLTLTQPVDPRTLVYGDTIQLTQNGELVPATMLVKGRSITLDPLDAKGNALTNHDLQPGQPLTVTLSAGVKNQAGEPLAPYQTRLTPQDTAPRALLIQRAAPAIASGSCLDSGVTTSPLTGDAINCVPVKARLLGDTTVSKLQGNIYPQLASPVHFPNITPLRIPRGSLLQGDPLQVLIGGQVDAGFDSGKVTVTILSDANGYLMPNPYTDDPSAPRRMVLTMDVAFSTEDPRANGAFNQTLLHVRLVGTAINDPQKGSLVANAIGVVEPRVLGVETAYGVLSFHMESYPEQTTAPEQPADMTAPVLDTWMPGDNVDKQRPGDPIILSFSEPLDGHSIQAGEDLTLTANGSAVPFDWRLDGVDLVIQPHTPLAYDTTYKVSYTNAITDLAGNGAEPGSRSFTLPPYVDSGASGTDRQSPIVLTVYPGFPCVTDGVNLAQNDVGRCLGGLNDDDHLPLARLPANLPITVTFSQAIDPATVNADTFVVEQVDASGAALGLVPGRRHTQGRTLVFTPEQPWQPDAYYRYTLKSVQTGADCGVDAICDTRGLPLQTKLLAAYPRQDSLPVGAPTEGADVSPEATDGGPDLPVYFLAVNSADGVLQHLRNLPTADVNANFLADAGEPLASDSDQVLKNSVQIIRDPDANPEANGASGGGFAVKDATVGCDFVKDGAGDYATDENGMLIPGDCPDAKYSYITGNLDVSLVGYQTPQQVAELVKQEQASRPDGTTTIPDIVQQDGGVLVYIYPTRLVVSNSTVFAVPSDLVAASGGTVPPAPTGPQLMRIRYTCNPANPATPCSAPDYGRVKGWIVDGDDGPQFLTSLTLYLDAPQLAPSTTLAGEHLILSHNLHSYPLDLQLAGAVTFLPDGRLQIAQISQNALHLHVDLLGLADIYVQIPAGSSFLNYVLAPIKN